MDIPIQVIAAVIGATPALLAPLISNVLQRRGAAQKAKEVEALERRVQIIERLLALETHLSAETRSRLHIELAGVAEEVLADQAGERSVSETAVERLPILRRWFLVYEQSTMKAAVYRGFFWFFLAIGSLGAISTYYVVPLDFSLLPFGRVLFAVSGGLFYVALGLIFRAKALRQERHARASTARVSTSDLSDRDDR